MVKFFIVSAFLITGCTSAFSGEIAGRVVNVSDGDTFTLLVDGNEKLSIRLAGIDAPERKQDYGAVAKSQLSELVFQKYVLVEFDKRDRYGRVLGKVLIDGVDVNLHMLETGYAWHYKKYEKEQRLDDRSNYSRVEALARLKRIGLWLDESPVPPWVFRHGNH